MILTARRYRYGWAARSGAPTRQAVYLTHFPIRVVALFGAGASFFDTDVGEVEAGEFGSWDDTGPVVVEGVNTTADVGLEVRIDRKVAFYFGRRITDCERCSGLVRRVSRGAVDDGVVVD